MTEELLEKASKLKFAIERINNRIENLSNTEKVEVNYKLDNMHCVFELEEEAVDVLISYYSRVLARLEQEFNDLK